ncbi:hypothetical protein Pfo_000947 [Paulownia fortunei]|nr:hypothetical protein Pfo_000947 [Paulownia fortunei]
MESPGSNADSPALSDVSSKNVEDKTTGPSDTSPEVPQPMEDALMANADKDREYGCKYCHKKFTNKQALGGHQNAHKVERAMDKNARDVHDNHFGYFGGSSSYHGMTSTPFLGSYNRSHEFMNRSIINWPYPSQQPVQHGIHIGYNPRPGLPMAGDPYAPRPGLPMAGDPYAPRPLPGFNNVYSGWAAPSPRVPQFTGQPSYMQNHALNLRFPTIGEGSSSARPFSQDLSTFNGSRLRPERNPGGQNENQMNDPGNEQLEDSDLDLSLKL